MAQICAKVPAALPLALAGLALHQLSRAGGDYGALGFIEVAAVL